MPIASFTTTGNVPRPNAIRTGASERGLLWRLKLDAYHGSPDAPTVDVR